MTKADFIEDVKYYLLNHTKGRAQICTNQADTYRPFDSQLAALFEAASVAMSNIHQYLAAKVEPR